MDSSLNLVERRDFKDEVRGFTERIGGQWLGEHGIRANLVSWTGIGLCVCASAVWAMLILWSPCFWLGLPVAIAGAYFDVIDGAVAKHQKGGPTPYGEYLDSSGDRWVDMSMGVAMLVVATAHQRGTIAITGCGLLIGLPLCVPYARAKAKLLGVVAKNGIGDRVGRLIALGGGVLLMKIGMMADCQTWLPWHLRAHYDYAAWPVVVMSLITVAQRNRTVKRQLDSPAAPGKTAVRES